MRWDPGHRSNDLIDRRGEGPGGGGGLPITLLFWILRSPLGWVGVILVLIGWGVVRLLDGGFAVEGGDPGSDEDAAFVGFVLDDVQDHWARGWSGYERAKLVLFRDSTRTACGFGDAATGPFYCPADRQVYLDLSFFAALHKQLGAPGDFAQAYVIAHEIGHHLQTLDGTSAKVHAAPQRDQKGAGGMSVRLELQADCYAGVWAGDAERRGLLEVGDLDEALRAAAAIGDDRLQRMGRGTVSPETFSHGTSAQRARWFRTGYTQRTAAACDTFSVREP